jgi:hypothetical protein
MERTQKHAARPISIDRITQSIVLLRGHKVLLDADLAVLYGVKSKALLQAVKRNVERFPDDFMLQMTADEWAALRSQFVTLKAGRGQHRKYLPYAFTEQGVAMLSSVLKSQRAIAEMRRLFRRAPFMTPTRLEMGLPGLAR